MVYIAYALVAFLALLVGCNKTPSINHQIEANTQKNYSVNPTIEEDRQVLSTRATRASVLADRAFNVAALVITQNDREMAEYLIEQAAREYPLVKITIVQVNGITPEAAGQHGSVNQNILIPAVKTAIGGRSFHMLQLFSDFPHFTLVPNAYPGSSCSIPTQPLWPTSTFLAGNGISNRYLSDSPYDFAIGSYVIPWKRAINSGPWNIDYLVAKLEYRTQEEGRRLIDLSCTPAGGWPSLLLLTLPVNQGQQIMVRVQIPIGRPMSSILLQDLLALVL